MAAAVVLLAKAPALAKVGPISVAATPEGVWVGRSEGGLVRIDPATGRVTATSDAVAFPGSLASGAGRLIAVDHRDGRVVVLTAEGAPAAGRRFRSFPDGVAIGARSAWALVHRSRRIGGMVLLRLDLHTLAVQGRFHLGTRAVRLATGAGNVWLSFDPTRRRGRTALVAIDEASGRLRFRGRIDGVSRGIAAGPAAAVVYLERGRGSRLVALDGRTGVPRWRARGPRYAGGVATAAGLVWVSTLCGGPRCDISLAAVRGHRANDGRLVAGPFRPWPVCRRGVRQLFLGGGVTALPGGAAAVPVGDGAGRNRLAIVSARRGVIRCPAV